MGLLLRNGRGGGMLRHLLATLVVSMFLASGRACIAADGIQFVGTKLLISKDVNGERWAITVEPVPLPDVGGLAITGNVFRSDGGPPSFISCEANIGDVLPPDLGTGLRMHCFAREACEGLSAGCFGGGSDLGEVLVPYSFFEFPAPVDGHRQDASFVLIGEFAFAEHFPLGSTTCLRGTCEDGTVVQSRSSFANLVEFRCPSGRSVQVEVIAQHGLPTSPCDYSGTVELQSVLTLGKVYNLDLSVIPGNYLWSMTGYSQPPR